MVGNKSYKTKVIKECVTFGSLTSLNMLTELKAKIGLWSKITDF